MLRICTRMFALFFFMYISYADTGIHHKLNATVDPENHFIEVTDQITIPAVQAKPLMHFILNSNLKVLSETPGVVVALDRVGVKAEDFGIDREDFTANEKFILNKYSLTFKEQSANNVTFTLKFSGEINYPIMRVGEEYARGFSQTPGIIDAKGVYLAGSTYWIPWFNKEWITFELTTTMSDSWEVVSQGKRILHEIKNGARVSKWDSPEPMEEVFLIAARFKEYALSAGATDVMAFLRTPDEALANKYLETTAQYLEMYRKLIGPYPFTKFALVENFWETGYGMPSFTLLGEQIIRFPFILHSSYPHELLHNYWGNSVYVDFKSGNWCEGLTAYMADHLIAEQRGQGAEYRRTALQNYTDYVNSSNDFPLNKFTSRSNSSSEAIGYGKSMMMWDMLRDLVGDESFVKGFQKFNRDNKFKAASFNSIRLAFEGVTGKDLKPFFDQWVERKGAPELNLSNVQCMESKNQYHLQFTLKQVQNDDAFILDIPVAISYEKKAEIKKVTMTQKEQTFELDLPENPLLVRIDPQFDLFRKLHYNEIPPSLSKIFGSEKLLILLPSKADQRSLEYYRGLAKTWANDSTKKIQILLDREIPKLPADENVWIFGMENIYASTVKEGLKEYHAEITAKFVRLGNATYKSNLNSYIISVRNPKNPSAVLVLLSTDSKEAAQGLAKKLPHYGKYSYLVFEGNEPTNTEKGEWESSNSPLVARIAPEGKQVYTELPARKALAVLAPVFSAERMLNTVNFLASPELAGRAPGSAGIAKAADYIVEKFKQAGLQPGSDDGSYTQTWDDVVDQKGTKSSVKNIIGIIPGVNQKWNDESVVICAHYDHLGFGWPGGNTVNVGKIHPGADDNASGVAVMLEIAELLGKNLKPQRTIVFVAFTNEEEGLVGSKYYVNTMKRFPAKKAVGVLNFDAVGRLGAKKLLVLSSNSAREWKFIFMGAGYVTGVESEMVTQDLDASDERSFIAVGVPGVQFFAGAYEDYHKPTDTPDKIDGAGLVKVATVAREAILYLADREGALTFQGQVATEAKKPQTTGERRVTTGSIPDFEYSGPGVRIADRSPDSPAAKAGLQKGDVILKIGKYEVTNLREYSDALKNFQPGDIVEVTFSREGKNQITKIELIAK
jgi:aminopeptidase N